jgi:dihydroneopterin aldolase
LDRITLAGMVFSGRHGVSDAERSRSQRFTVDLQVETDIKRAARSDDIAKTVDYRELRRVAGGVIKGPPAHLIEALAERIAAEALKVRGVTSVEVRVSKQPASMRPIDSASVWIRRTKR